MDNTLSWSALEYEDKERSKDWFWALGIVVVTSTIAAIIFGNYFFAVLLILSGLLLAFFAIKKPDIISYQLNRKGLQIGNRLYPYEAIKSFWIQLDFADEPNQQKLKSLLFIHSERAFMPMISIPIEDSMAEDIHEIFTSQNIEEKQMKESTSEKIMEVLGF